MLADTSKGKIVMAAGTLCAALSIGFAMQMFDRGPVLSEAENEPEGGLQVEDIELTSSAIAIAPVQMPGANAALALGASSMDETPASLNANAIIASADPVETTIEMSCEIDLQAHVGVAAMVNLSMAADCLPNERFVLHHSGMMFSAYTDENGAASLEVPALAENAVFIASFSNGEGAVVQQEVPTLGDFSRVVVQWSGAVALGLHAREYNADYFTAGHIHADATGSLENVDMGASGMMHVLGDASAIKPLMAQIYTYPVSKAMSDGIVHLSVEAEVTAANCGAEVEAQTLQLGEGNAIKVQDFTLYVPDCDAQGDFLVLKNVVEDMTLAAR